MGTTIAIPLNVYQQMISHLKHCYPEEGCGLLAGQKAHITHHFTIENILHNQSRYEMNPKELINAFVAAEEQGVAMKAIYHSHPAGPETPSPTDIRQATYPEFLYIIVSLQLFEKPSFRGFYLVDDSVQEVSLKLV